MMVAQLPRLLLLVTDGDQRNGSLATQFKNLQSSVIGSFLQVDTL